MNHVVNKKALMKIHSKQKMSRERQGNRQREREKERGGGDTTDREREIAQSIVNIYLQMFII